MNFDEASNLFSTDKIGLLREESDGMRFLKLLVSVSKRLSRTTV